MTPPPTPSPYNSRRGTSVVATAVRTLSSLSQSTSTVRTAFYSPNHFPKFLGVIALGSCVAGFFIRERLTNRRLEVRQKIYLDAYENGAPSSTAMTTTLRKDRAGDEFRVRMDAANRLARNMTRTMTRRVVASTPSADLQRQVTKHW